MFELDCRSSAFFRCRRFAIGWRANEQWNAAQESTAVDVRRSRVVGVLAAYRRQRRALAVGKGSRRRSVRRRSSRSSRVSGTRFFSPAFHVLLFSLDCRSNLALVKHNTDFLSRRTVDANMF